MIQESQSHAVRGGTRPVSILLATPLVVSILIAVIRGSRHFAEGWSVHAQHHLVGHIAAAAGIAVVALLLVAGPMRRRERWAWWALVVSGASIYGSYWLGNVTVGLGIEALMPNTAQAILTVVYSLGLVMGWSLINQPVDTRQRVESQAAHL